MPLTLIKYNTYIIKTAFCILANEARNKKKKMKSELSVGDNVIIEKINPAVLKIDGERYMFLEPFIVRLKKQLKMTINLSTNIYIFPTN